MKTDVTILNNDCWEAISSASDGDTLHQLRSCSRELHVVVSTVIANRCIDLNVSIETSMFALTTAADAFDRMHHDFEDAYGRNESDDYEVVNEYDTAALKIIDTAVATRTLVDAMRECAIGQVWVHCVLNHMKKLRQLMSENDPFEYTWESWRSSEFCPLVGIQTLIKSETVLKLTFKMQYIACLHSNLVSYVTL